MCSRDRHIFFVKGMVVQLHHLVDIFDTSSALIFVLLLDDAAIMWVDEELSCRL